METPTSAVVNSELNLLQAILPSYDYDETEKTRHNQLDKNINPQSEGCQKITFQMLGRRQHA